MAFERQDTFNKALRTALTDFMRSYERLQALRNNFDALGGDPFFTAYFAASPAKEISQGEQLAAVVSINNLETAMNLGPKSDFYKAKG